MYWAITMDGVAYGWVTAAVAVADGHLMVPQSFVRQQQLNADVDLY